MREKDVKRKRQRERESEREIKRDGDRDGDKSRWRCVMLEWIECH